MSHEVNATTPSGGLIPGDSERREPIMDGNAASNELRLERPEEADSTVDCGASRISASSSVDVLVHGEAAAVGGVPASGPRGGRSGKSTTPARCIAGAVPSIAANSKAGSTSLNSTSSISPLSVGRTRIPTALRFSSRPLFQREGDASVGDGFSTIGTGSGHTTMYTDSSNENVMSSASSSTGRQSQQQPPKQQQQQQQQHTSLNRPPATVGAAASATATVQAACLPPETLYSDMINYQEEHDDHDETASIALRSVSTWYSVRSDDDRKIPPRPPPSNVATSSNCASEGASGPAAASGEGSSRSARSPFRRPPQNQQHRPPLLSTSSSIAASIGTSFGSTTESSCGSVVSLGEDVNDDTNDDNTAQAAMHAAMITISSKTAGASVASSTHCDSSTLAMQNRWSAGCGASSGSSRESSSGGSGGGFDGRKSPCKAKVTRTRTRSRSPAPPTPNTSGFPSIIYEDETDNQTALSSLVSSSHADVPLNILEAIRETAAMNEFASLTAAAQLAQESQMGNMAEPTRSAPTPCAASMNVKKSDGMASLATNFMPSGNCAAPADGCTLEGMTVEEREMQLAFQNLVPINPKTPSSTNFTGATSKTSSSSSSSRVRTKHHDTKKSSTRSVDRDCDRTSSRTPANSETPRDSPSSGPVAATSRASRSASPNPSERGGGPVPVGSLTNGYALMQQTLGMEHLSLQQSSKVSGSGPAFSPLNCSADASTTEALAETVRRKADAGKSKSFTGAAIPTTQNESSGSRVSSQTKRTSDRVQESISSDTGAEVTSNAGTDNVDIGEGNSSTDEQYKIWRQIQKDLEEKELELAVQLSQKRTEPSAIAVEPSKTGGGGGFVYPDQHGKPSTDASDTNNDQDDAEDEALKEILRISQEEAAAAEAARNKPPEVEEDEIALALQMSRKQAEEDRLRLERLQQTAGELSEEDQLRLAMEQSMNPNPSGILQENISGNADDSSLMDEDLKFALLLSQEAQQAEETNFSQPLYEQQLRSHPSARQEDPSKSQAIPNSLPDRSVPPGVQHPTLPRESDGWRALDERDPQIQDPSPLQQLETNFPYEEFSVQPMPDNDPNSVRWPGDGGDALPTRQPQRKASEEEKNSSLKLSSRPRLSRQSSFDVDVDEETRIAMLREGQLDTRLAIMQGESQIVTCQGCMGKLHAPSQCSLVFCPTCNTVSPVDGNFGAGA